MTLERMLSIAAYIMLCGFLFVLVWKIPRLDIGLVCVATLVLCGYDMFAHRPPSQRV